VNANNESWVNLVEEEEKGQMQPLVLPMEIEEGEVISTSTKRKANRITDSDSDETKAPDPKIRKAKFLEKLRPRTTAKTSCNVTENIIEQRDEGKDPDGSNTEATQTTDGAEVQKKKVGRPKRKVRAIDPIVAENEIQNKIGQAPEGMEKEVLYIMTASDLSAQTLDYISDIETIRTKCGRMQGGLSGKLKRRLMCLQDLIRALQNKADSSGDPKFLRAKINTLSTELEKERKYNKREEERRKREISEMQEIISELKNENKSIREEMRRIKKSMERDNEYRNKESLSDNLQTNLQTKTRNLPNVHNLPSRKSFDDASHKRWSPERQANKEFRWNLQARPKQDRRRKKKYLG